MMCQPQKLSKDIQYQYKLGRFRSLSRGCELIHVVPQYVPIMTEVPRANSERVSEDAFMVHGA